MTKCFNLNFFKDFLSEKQFQLDNRFCLLDMYITEKQLKGFDSYKYRCLDTSPLAIYVMHPFWNQFVKVFPKWLAPNLMTFAGFLLLAVQVGILAYYDPYYMAAETSPAIPTWVWIFSVFAQFFSHTLDGCDGKQARRTGTSSPLGEMFDHGLDSWSASFFIFNIYSIFGCLLVSVTEMITVFWVVMFSFYMSHWEKYNTGVLYLPWAYDSSQVALALVYLVSAVYGPQIWHGSVFGIPIVLFLKAMLYFGSVVLGIPTCLYNVYVSKKDGTGKNYSLYEMFLPLFSPLLFMLILTIWVMVSPSNILHTNIRLLMFVSSVILSNMACRLIVAQMSDTRCQVLNPFISVVLLALIAVMLTNNPKVEVSLLWTITLAITLGHIHYGIVVVRTLAAHLKIPVFTVKKSD